MKRIIAAILCVVMVFALGIPTVFAEEYVISYGAISSQNDERESAIVFDNPSNYCIMIPETIVADGNYLNFSANSMNLHDNECVEVYSTTGSRIELTSTETNDIAIFLFNTDYNSDVVARFNNGDLQPNYIVTNSVENANEIAAAHYSGTATFKIRLVEKT